MVTVRRKYVFLFGTSYPNSFKDIFLQDALALFPRGESAFTHEQQAYLREVFKGRFATVSYAGKELEEVVSAAKAQALVSIGWRRIISSQLIASVPTCVNVHPALLPYYRGYHTEPYVIMNNEREHGITAHVVTSGVDAGPIILQKRFPISEFSTVKSIKRAVQDLMPDFLAEVLLILESNDVRLTTNDLTMTKIVAPKRHPHNSEVDPSLPLIQLYHRIRACDPQQYPAFFLYKGTKVFIRLSRDRATHAADDYEL